MSLDMKQLNQESLFSQLDFRTMIHIPNNHPLIILNQSIPWQELMEEAIPLLYQDQGIAIDIGRRLNLRAHLGAYILQSVHNWTDRWTEEMLKFYVPARIFCGFMESTGSLDHTKIEEFRNRLGETGAQLISEEVFKIAKKFGFTQPTDVDMDTTVQEAGITHPTEMKLLSHLAKRFGILSKKLKELTGKGLKKSKILVKEMKQLMTHYRFFSKTKNLKTKMIKKSQKVASQIMESFQELFGREKKILKLPRRCQQEVTRYLDLVPTLLDQITYWIRTGKVASSKIISLWKRCPQAIRKGKLSKPVEFGRKWIINQYRGGYVLVKAPMNVKLSDQLCVEESLDLHMRVTQEVPKSFTADRGMYGMPNLELCHGIGIKKIGIQPSGRALPLVTKRQQQLLSNRRASIEPRIGHLKRRGLGVSRMKSDTGDLISGFRSALSFNLSLMVKDLQEIQFVHT